MLLGSSAGLVGVGDAIGTGVLVIVGVKVSVGVKVLVGVGVIVGVRVGVKVAEGGSVGVRLAMGWAVGTAVTFWASDTGVDAFEDGIVAEKGVTTGAGWQAASKSEKQIRTKLRIIINSNLSLRGLHHP